MYTFFKTKAKKILSFLALGPFIPKSFELFNKGYDRSHLLDDARAGITVGCISLPLAMAFAIGSGVTPERGLYTAIVAGFLISLLGGSRVQIGGPTGAYVVLLYSIVQKHGYEGLALATLIAGLLLAVAGFLRLGSLIRFIPYPVTTGFTAGIATVLFVSQIKDFCGFAIATPSVIFTEKITQYAQFFYTLNPYALILGLSTLVLILFLRRYYPKIPASISAVVVATIAAYLFDLPIKTIENSYGEIPSSLPSPQLPYISLQAIQAVLPDAIAIALLGAIESLLSCVIADSLTGYRHKSNCELVGQGFANIASSLFGGIAATGAIARTGANVQLGAKTPLAGIICAATVLVLMLAFSPFAAKMPLCALGAVLMVVAWNMSEIKHMGAILTGPITDRIILISTYVLTVLIDLTFAVQIGVLLAGISFLKKMTEKTVIETEYSQDGVLQLTLKGPFFFGISEILNDALVKEPKTPNSVVLSLSHVPFVDATGIQAIKQFQKRCHSKQISFFVSDVQPEVLQALSHAKLIHLMRSEKSQVPALGTSEKMIEAQAEPV